MKKKIFEMQKQTKQTTQRQGNKLVTTTTVVQPAKGKKPQTQNRKKEGIRLKAPTKQAAVVQIRQDQQRKLMSKKYKMAGKSANFFTEATDPMHDSVVQNVGWPDRNIEQSVIRRITSTQTLGFPADNVNYNAEEVWDAHVIMQPWMNAVIYGQHDRVNNTLIEASNIATARIGGIQSFATKVGETFAYGSDDPATGQFPRLGEFQLDPAITVGMGRIVGLGIEAINTTSALHKQGHVYCWRAPEPALVPATYSYERAIDTPPPAVPVASFPFTGELYRYPAGNVAQAQLYTGTVDWPAAEGAYMVGTFHDFENPAQMVNYIQPLLQDLAYGEDHTTNEPSAFTSNIAPIWAPHQVVGSNTGPTAGYSGNPAFKIYPLNQMGMIFTGLSKETTIDVKVVVYYESFPSLAQVDILTLANPSTRYDPRVLELLAAVMRTMPVATMSKNNASGDWWDQVLEALQFVAPGVLAAFGGEILAPGVAGALTAIRSYRNGK